VRSSLNDFPAAEFDVITLSHVIEHVPDPVATLKDCASRLRKGGRLIVATPNIKSWGHRYFGEKWVGLDPPRHLMLFSPRNLAQCAERAGLRIENLRTSSRSASFVWSWSHLIRRLGALRGVPAHSLEKIRSKLAGVVFQALEHSLLGKDAGEEIVLLARRD
jgi:SAM-dependent methyltransferase